MAFSDSIMCKEEKEKVMPMQENQEDCMQEEMEDDYSVVEELVEQEQDMEDDYEEFDDVFENNTDVF